MNRIVREGTFVPIFYTTGDFGEIQDVFEDFVEMQSTVALLPPWFFALSVTAYAAPPLPGGEASSVMVFAALCLTKGRRGIII